MNEKKVIETELSQNHKEGLKELLMKNSNNFDLQNLLQEVMGRFNQQTSFNQGHFEYESQEDARKIRRKRKRKKKNGSLCGSDSSFNVENMNEEEEIPKDLSFSQSILNRSGLKRGCKGRNKDASEEINHPISKEGNFEELNKESRLNGNY